MRDTCTYCGTESGLYFRSRDYNRHVTRECFSHYLCPNCGLIFISPIPENLGEYYPQTYYSIPESVKVLEEMTAQERYKIEIIQRYIKHGRLLEIGPSMGCFTYLAKQSGFEAEAIEMDDQCSKFLNEVAGIPTINTADTCGALETVKSYDVITLWHVIEHLPDPWETLEAISRKINPGGILVLATPNPEAFQFRILKRYWPHLDAPRHVMLIPSRVLEEKMRSLGMKTELLTTNDEGSLGWNVFGWEFFFSNLSSRSKIKKLLSVAGYAVAKLVSPVEKTEGKGSAYTMVFRKVA